MKNKSSLFIWSVLLSTGFMLPIAQAADGNSSSQQVYRSADQKSFQGPENLFTGKVKLTSRCCFLKTKLQTTAPPMSLLMQELEPLGILTLQDNT